MEPPAFEDPRAALRRHGLKPKRSFSQNFLVSRGTVETIAGTPALERASAVIEIGPGVGTLTAALLRRGARVLAVERDRDMAALLRQDLGAVPGFSLLEQDATRLDLAAQARELGGPVALLGNLPYAITGALMRVIVEGRESLTEAVVMVQREVQRRLTSEPGTKSYGALSVFVQAAYRVERVCAVPAGAFFPPPRVESAVVRLLPHTVARAQETAAFRAVVKGAFSRRRKTLRNALAPLAPDGSAATRVERAGLDPKARGETLSVEQFDALARSFEDLFPSTSTSGKVRR